MTVILPGMTQDHKRVQITPQDDHESLLGKYTYLLYYLSFLLRKRKGNNTGLKREPCSSIKERSELCYMKTFFYLFICLVIF